MKGVLIIALLTTKLFISRLRKNLVPRPPLVDRPGIKQGTDRAGVTAPAAFAKTTSLRDWISQCSHYITLLSTNDSTWTPGVASCKLTWNGAR